MQENGFKIAIVGATGKVGREIIEILNSRKFPISKLVPIASDNSVDKQILFGKYNKIQVETLRDNSFKDIDFAFFATNADISAKYVPSAIKMGCIVIDNSSYFRKTTDIPLIIPEINPEQIYDYKSKNIICNPNCVAIQTLMAIKNFHELSNISKIVLSTYQSISGAGQYAMDQLYHQTKNKFMADLGYNASRADESYSKYVFNCVPQIGNLMPNNDYEEEDKVKYEIKRILNAPEIVISATCVRVPVFIGHGISLHLQLEEKIDIEELKALLSSNNDIYFGDNDIFTHESIAKTDHICIARLRAENNENDPNIKEADAFSIWIMADNIRKGAALNAVQIAELLLKPTMNN